MATEESIITRQIKAVKEHLMTFVKVFNQRSEEYKTAGSLVMKEWCEGKAEGCMLAVNLLNEILKSLED